MIQFSFFIDRKKRIFLIRFQRFLYLMMEKGKLYIRIMGFKIPFPYSRKKIYLPRKLVYLKKGYLFLRKWRLKKIDADLSFSDPMVNGIAYGMMRAIETVKRDQRVKVDINFLGINRLKAEFVISSWTFIKQLKNFFFPLLCEMRRGLKKEVN